MNECKLVYQGRSLNNKAETLRNIMSAADSAVNEVTVTSKNELEAYAEQIGSIVQLFQQYPTYFAGGAVVVLFLILFLMGGS
jgi:hypothetical protein